MDSDTHRFLSCCVLGDSHSSLRPAEFCRVGCGPVLLICPSNQANLLSPKDHYCSAGVEWTFRSVLIQGRSRCESICCYSRQLRLSSPVALLVRVPRVPTRYQLVRGYSIKTRTGI